MIKSDIMKKRKELFLEFKKTNSEEVLVELIYSFKPHIETIIQRYNYDLQELKSIAVEAVINCINDCGIDTDIDNIGAYIHKYINKYIRMYILEPSISYDQYIKTHQNGEEGSYIDMDDILLKPIISDMLKYLSINYPECAEVLIYRYGLDGNLPMTLENIAKLQNISFQAVKKRETKALSLLKTKYSKYKKELI